MEPIALHVNHHLRESADRDELFVEEVCERFAIPLAVADLDLTGCPGNVAAEARRLRYDALVELSEGLVSHVAVAHHVDDQLETILMALCRGAGLDGLSGMRWGVAGDS